MDDERYRFFTVIGMEIKNTEDSNEFKRLSEYITLLIKSQVQDDSIKYKFPIYFRMDTQITENQEQIEKLNNIFCNILYEYMLEGETVIDKHIKFTLSDEQLTALKRHLKEYKHRIFNENYMLAINLGMDVYNTASDA